MSRSANLRAILTAGLRFRTVLFAQRDASRAFQPRPADSQRRLRFIFISTCADYDFFLPVKKGMQDAAVALGVECSFTGTRGVDLKAQVQMVRDAVAAGYDGIALNIIDPSAFNAVVQEAIDRGVPVVAFNVDGSQTPNARLSAVCQKLYEAGRALGEAAAPFIPVGSKVLVTMHDAGVSALEDRLRGAADALKVKSVTTHVIITGTERDEAIASIRQALAENPEISFVLATGMADTEAAGLVIERHFHGRGYSAVGFDLTPEILAARQERRDTVHG